MTTIRVGAAVDAIPRPRYFETHGLLELHAPLSFPRASTLARWRAAVPLSCEIALGVTRRTHGGRDGALRFEKAGSRTWLEESIATLSPRFVLLSTGPDLSTGTRDRQLLSRFVEDVRARGPLVVWQPRGLWEHDEAERFAREVGCELALDVLGASVGPKRPDAAALMGLEPEVARTGSVAYARLEALGTHARLGDGHLRRALDEALATGAADVRLVISAEDGLRKASRLAAIVAGLADATSGLAAPRRRAAAGAVETEGDDLEDAIEDDEELEGEDELDGDEDDLEDDTDDDDGDE